MKIRIPDWLLLFDLLTAVTVIVTAISTSNALRLVVGLPLLLLFPGYALLRAVFVDRTGMDAVQQIALSGALSMAVSALIGFGLDFTVWGITLESAMYAVAGFVGLASSVAVVREAVSPQGMRLAVEINLGTPFWKSAHPHRAQYLVLSLLVLCSLGAMGYFSGVFHARAAFQEFYVLGAGGKAENYPTTFLFTGGRLSSVAYGFGSGIAGATGNVTLAIVNHDKAAHVFAVRLTIDGSPCSFDVDGQTVTALESIRLLEGERWQKTVAFTPQKLGDNQKVEFFLFKDGQTTPAASLTLWVNARES